MLKYLTAGDSHGEALMAVVEGLPAGVRISEDDINLELARRQKGYGRGLRMNIENDRVKILSGVRWGQTTGAPIGMMIPNRDYNNCVKLMSKLECDKDSSVILAKPRPGHADLAGMLKFAREDFRDILERASARETAVRVSVGTLAKKMISIFGVGVYSHVIKIGNAVSIGDRDIDWDFVEKSPVRCADKNTGKRMIKLIEKAVKSGDTIGGVFQIVVRGCPAGLGSHVSGDRKLDAKIARGIISIQAVKGVEFGDGFAVSEKYGSKAHDEIYYSKQEGFYRLTNRAGGFEGGMTNGEDLVIQAVMKPIASLAKPLKTVDLKTLSSAKAEIIRSDVCAVPAAAVVGESAVAWEIACAFSEKFGGDSIREMKVNYDNYCRQINNLDFLPKRK